MGSVGIDDIAPQHCREGLAMRVYSPVMRREKNLLSSSHPLTCLFSVDIPGAPIPFRLANYSEDILFHGLVYTVFPVSVDSVEDTTSSTLAHLRVAPQNVSQEMIALFENYWYDNPHWTVTMWHVDAENPDDTPFNTGSVYTVMNAPTDVMSATFDLVAEGFTLTTLLPRRKYTTASGFPHIPRR